MDDKLKTTIDKIVQLTKQNPEFDTLLRKRLDISSSVCYSLSNNVPQNIAAIRSALEIRGAESINYDFVTKSRLKDQLIIDNLRMENAALNLTEKEESRFYVFCVNAFYQIENIINYYYFKTFSNNIEAILIEIESKTKEDKSSEADYSFHRNKTNKEKTVADIPINYKLNAFCNTFFPGDKIKWTFSSLRKVRNESEHRCDAIFQGENEKEKLYQFYKNNNFDSIRNILARLVYEVKNQLTNNICQIEKCEIKTMLPSACFISLKGKDIQLPHNLFKLIKEKKAGDSVTIWVCNGIITNVQ